MRNHLNEIRPKDEKYYGIYRGIIEDNKDPDKRGRCKVRVFGIHDEAKTESKGYGIPTSKLPWAEPALGLFEGSVTGFGAWTIPLQGSHVFVFFENNNKHQIRFFASAPGLPTESSDPSKGFNDPDGVYPLSHRLNEPDWHRLARNESASTIVDYKDENLTTDIKKALNRGEWSEPESYYNKSTEKYPNNNVFATHNGIIIEVDTSDNPRIHVYHPSNSYIEIDNDGNQVVKTTGDRYDIVLKNINKHVKENDNLTVEGNKTVRAENEYNEILSDREEEVGGNKDLKVVGNVTIEIGGNRDVTISGSENITISGSQNVNISGSCNITVGSNCDLSVGGTCSVTAPMITFN